MQRPSSTRWKCGPMMLMLLAAAAWAAKDTAVVAAVRIASGPHAGSYTYDAADACVIATFEEGRPAGFSVALASNRSTLAVDMPSTDPAQLGEIRIEVVVANAKPSQGQASTASTTYLIDTRPDAVLSSYQRQERAAVGMTGKATVQLTPAGANATLKFNAETAAGIKLEGSVECKKVDRDYGR